MSSKLAETCYIFPERKTYFKFGCLTTPYFLNGNDTNNKTIAFDISILQYSRITT